MTAIKIYDTKHTGELRWGIAVVGEKEEPILRSDRSLGKGAALANAKSILHEGSAAPFWTKGEDGDSDKPAWIVDEKTDDGWLIEFTPIQDTKFILLWATSGGHETIDDAIKTFDAARNSLATAKIVWDPPEADPAHKEKEEDTTETKGLPGS